LRVHQRICPLVRSWDAAADDPQAIATRYDEIHPPLRDAKHWRAAMWAAVKTFMVAGERERFSDFLLQTRVIRTVPIRALATAVTDVDPMGIAEFAVSVPGALLEGCVPAGKRPSATPGRRR
jgi:hypothetical protein